MFKMHCILLEHQISQTLSCINKDGHGQISCSHEIMYTKKINTIILNKVQMKGMAKGKMTVQTAKISELRLDCNFIIKIIKSLHTDTHTDTHMHPAPPNKYGTQLKDKLQKYTKISSNIPIQLYFQKENSIKWQVYITVKILEIHEVSS